MLLAIDSLADRYKVLPHKVLEEASTFDLYVLNAGIEWRNKQQLLAENSNGLAVPHLSQDEMKQMINAVRSEK